MLSGHGVALRLRGAYLTMHRQANAQFAELGVTADQFVLLALLAEEDGVTQKDLVGRSCSDPNTVHAMLVLLEQQGLVVRERHATDGRARSVSLTRKGRDLHQQLEQGSRQFHAGLLALFQPEEAAALVGYLDRIAQHMETARRLKSQERPQPKRPRR